MFDHVRGDRLDQQKYPWISLTQAAIYLMPPDDAERQRAINSHDWERPFKRLHKWIEDGKLTVYEGWNEPYKSIPKEDFFGIWIRYPSYPDNRQEDIRRAYQSGFRTFIDCDRLQPRNRYFEARKFEPKWRDLIIRSQELVAIFEAEKAFNEIAAIPDEISAIPTEHRASRKSELVKKAIAGLFPEGISKSLPNKDLVQQIMKWLTDYCKENGIPLPAISATTILRASGRKDKDA
jgi:hypothetical protein